MNENFLQLLNSKAIHFDTPNQLNLSPISSVSFLGHNLPISPSVTNLGVKFDPYRNICKVFFLHLYNIASLSPPAAEKLVQAFVSSRLRTTVPVSQSRGFKSYNILKTEMLMRVHKHVHITPILHAMDFQIEFKI